MLNAYSRLNMGHAGEILRHTVGGVGAAADSATSVFRRQTSIQIAVTHWERMGGNEMSGRSPLPSTSFNARKLRTRSIDRSDFETDDTLNVLTVAVERGLSVLGESIAQVIFYHMDKKYSLKRHEILKKPDRFVEALQDMFGSGAATIEKLIIESICSSIGLSPSNLNTLTLSQCIKEAEVAVKIGKTGNDLL